MDNKETPLQLDGVSEDIYAGFWLRLGSLLLDFIFVIPVTGLMLYFNSLGKDLYFYTVIPGFLFGLWYNIYLPKRYGGTAGKLVAGIKIIRIDGQSIGWKEAVLRHIVLLGLTIFSVILMISCVLMADEETYSSLSWLKQSPYLMSFSPILFTIYTWASNIWVYSEFIVLLTNRRKRAIHDFIAGTVIVKGIYIDRIRAAMNSEYERIATT